MEKSNTVVPVFIVYTPSAEKSYHNMLYKITSFIEFMAIYMKQNSSSPADPAEANLMPSSAGIIHTIS